MDDTGCSTQDTAPYNLMQLAYSIIGIIVWSLLLIVHFSASAVFHRNFSVLFSCTIACFMSISIAELPGLYRVLTMNDFEDYSFKDFFFAFPDVFYTAQLFLIPTLLIERVIATKKHATYEIHGNSYFPFLIVVFLLVGVSMYIYFWREYYYYDMYISLAIAAVNMLGASILRLKNRRMISASHANGNDLSTKYQMNENVRALQIIIFYCMFEALFTIIDSLAMIIHKVDFMFSIRDCRAKQHELFVYWRSAGFALQIALPIFLILFHENYEIAFLRMFCGCWCSGGRRRSAKVKFRADDSEMYFRDLDKQWDRLQAVAIGWGTLTIIWLVGFLIIWISWVQMMNEYNHPSTSLKLLVRQVSDKFLFDMSENIEHNGGEEKFASEREFKKRMKDAPPKPRVDSNTEYWRKIMDAIREESKSPKEMKDKIKEMREIFKGEVPKRLIKAYTVKNEKEEED